MASAEGANVSDDEQSEATAGSDVTRARVLTLVQVLLPLLPTFIWCVTHERIGQMESHDGRLKLAIASIVLLVVTVLASKKLGLDFPGSLLRSFGRAPRALPTDDEDPFELAEAPPPVSPAMMGLGRVLIGVWLSTACFGAFNYYQFDHRVLTTPGDYADATFYYINSKYFDELGYHRLYEAMLVADREGPGRFGTVRRYRDLVGYYDIFPANKAYERADEVRGWFSDARWAAFKHDVDWITSQAPEKKRWDYFFIDHGYNPPPTWTLVGGTLAELCPVESIKVITSIDIVLIGLVFVAIGWAFGGWALLLCLVWFTCTFSGRWPILGQSLLRFDWVSALVIGVCMLKRGLHGWAGGLLTYATLNRVFPGVFGIPYVVDMVKGAWQRKQAGEPLLTHTPKQFLIGVSSALVVFGLGAAVIVGPDSYVAAAHNLSLHGSPDSWSSHRVGLGDALVFQFETSNKEINEHGGMTGKTKELWALQPFLKMLGGLSVIGIILVIWRRREPIWRRIWLGIFPLFILTTPQINYYNLRLLLVLLHTELMARVGGRWHAFPLAWLFLIEVVSQYAMVERMPRYTVTSLTSVGLVVYLAAMAWMLVREAWHGEPELVDDDGDSSDDDETSEA